MKNQIPVLLLTLIAILITSSCNLGEVVDPQDGTNMISAKIDGGDFSVSGLLVSAEYSDINGMVHTLSIGGAKPPLNGVTEGIVLAIVSTDSSGIKAGETYTAVSTAKVGAGEYVFEDSSSDIKAYSENTDVATITVTKIDFTEKMVSGTFSFDAVDEDDPNKVYQIRDGKFEDVSFE